MTSTLTVEVHARTWRYEAEVEWPGGERRALADQWHDEAYWAPDGARHWTHRDVDTWLRAALQPVARELLAMGDNFRRADDERALTGLWEGRVRPGATAEQVAAELLVGSWSVRPGAAMWLERQLGLRSGEVQAALSGGHQSIAAAAAPERPYPYEVVSAIERTYGDPGQDLERSDDPAERLETDGFELRYGVRQSALRPADLATSLTFGIRFEDGLMAFRADSPALGGTVRGFHGELSASATTFDRDGYRLSFGITGGREVVEGLGDHVVLAPLGRLEVPLGGFGVAQAEIDLNPFALWDGLREGPRTTRAFAPLSLAVSFEALWPLYLRGSARHDLGAGSDHPIRWGIELGARL